MISSSETLNLQISGIFGKYHRVPALFLCSKRVCFWPLLKQDLKLRGPLLWRNIADFKFLKNGLWTRTFLLPYQGFCFLFPHSDTEFPDCFEHLNKPKKAVKTINRRTKNSHIHF